MAHRTRSAAALAILAVTALTPACADSGAQPSDTAPARTGADGPIVAVVDNDFEPSEVTIDVGETVTWTWEGEIPHDVAGESFASEVQREGRFEHTFTEPGTFDYRCTVHQGMRGTVEVTTS